MIIAPGEACTGEAVQRDEAEQRPAGKRVCDVPAPVGHYDERTVKGSHQLFLRADIRQAKGFLGCHFAQALTVNEIAQANSTLCAPCLLVIDASSDASLFGFKPDNAASE
jgi:hypothetical protein